MARRTVDLGRVDMGTLTDAELAEIIARLRAELGRRQDGYLRDGDLSAFLWSTLPRDDDTTAGA